MEEGEVINWTKIYKGVSLGGRGHYAHVGRLDACFQENRSASMVLTYSHPQVEYKSNRKKKTTIMATFKGSVRYKCLAEVA